MTSSDNKVVQAFPSAELPENLMRIEARNAGLPYYCQHEAIALNEHDRSVNCDRCGATLDPFNFLMSNARTIQSAWSNYREANRKVSELNERVALLHKEEKRLRGQVARLKEKASVVLSVRTGE